MSSEKDRSTAQQTVVATVRAHWSAAMKRVAELELRDARTVNHARNHTARMQIGRDLRFAKLQAEAWESALAFVQGDLDDVDAGKEFSEVPPLVIPPDNHAAVRSAGGWLYHDDPTCYSYAVPPLMFLTEDEARVLVSSGAVDNSCWQCGRRVIA